MKSIATNVLEILTHRHQAGIDALPDDMARIATLALEGRISYTVAFFVGDTVRVVYSDGSILGYGAGEWAVVANPTTDRHR